MSIQLETLRRHAGTLVDDGKSTQSEGLYDHIWRLRKHPDDAVLPNNRKALERNLKDFLHSAFALDQGSLDRNCLYAFSRLGTELSKIATRCETIEATKDWIRLRLILDISLDAIIAGDMQPYEEMVPPELSANGIEFSIFD